MNTAFSYEQQGLLHQMFSRQAQTTPKAIAVIEENGKYITFEDLEEKSDLLGKYLVYLGVTPNSCVGMYLNKSIEYVIAYIAILKAGAAYLPLDVAYPQSMLNSVLEDATPSAVVTTRDLVHTLSEFDKKIVLEKGWEDQLATGEANLPTELTLDNLAYIVYSSGTTGKPKGVICPHRGAVFSYHWRHEAYPFVTGEKVACNIFFSWEMLRPLLKGVTMYIISNTTIYDPPLLCQYIQRNKITQILFTPSLLEAILNTPELDLQQLKSLRQIWFCGEVVTTGLFERCLKLLPWIQFLNLYSISESHDVACEDLNLYFNDNMDALKTRKFCPVGNILPGVNLVIMDKDQQVKPVGASGEIFVGGPTLAVGYLNRPEIQKMRFIPVPKGVQTSHGDRLYRTGDWGYMLSDGRLEICGRCDSMVKIRGYSIEVQAVESALMELPMVNACVVLVEGGEGEDKFLVSYIVPEGQTTKKDIRAVLKLRLPFFMIPSYFVLLKSIPIVETTGKLDKSALPKFDKESMTDSDSISTPKTDMEKQMSQVWSKVLKIQDIDVQDSFFDLGGHSLLATELMMNLRQIFDIDLNVRDLFTYPTIATLSQFIEAKKNNATDKLETIPQVSVNLQNEVDRHDPQGIINIDMQLRAFWRTFYSPNSQGPFKKGRVLLTGATGFLGAFLLKELLLQTKCLIKCLVRELPEVTPSERVLNTFTQFGIISPDDTGNEEQTLIQTLYGKRVEVVKGDVALRNLGMNEDDYTYLCTDIDFIIHAAAFVNLVYPYEAFTGPNVTGTRNIIMFSCTGKIKPIHYISTDAVFPTGKKNCSEDESIENNHSDLHDGYSQSKWVAEQLMTRAGQKGLPVVIYRLGNMSGDRKQGFWNPQDFTLNVLQACAQYGLAPDVEWEMEMTPVDFAAEFIVRCSYNLSSILGKTYHIINDKPLHSRWVFEWMNAHGFPLQIVSFNEWKTRILSALESTKNGQFSTNLHRLLDSYLTDSDFFTNLSTYRTDNFKQTLDMFHMNYPYTDSRLLKCYFVGLSQRKVIVPLKHMSLFHENRKLEGKVAIVTGASSGIGRAIAVALSGAGAKVAMAARRKERLEEIGKEIEEQDGVCISVKTDVTKRDEVKELVRHTESVFGPVDILVNNAGVMYYTMMKNLHEDEWERQIDLNCKGLTNGIGAVLDGMLDRGAGHIVNMSSDAGRKGFPGLAVYSGTKFYVEGLSQALRQEVCESGIKVTCIQPGDVKTELISHSTDKEAQEKYDGSTSHKILEPTDIANAVLYAVTQPDYVGVNEILVEPRTAPV